MTGIATRERLLLWHTEGHHAPDAITAQDMLEKSGLNWGVHTEEISVQRPDGTRVEGGHRKAIVRDDTYDILGVVKSRYVPFSNAEVFNFLDNLTDTGEALYEAAWSWRKGETVGVALRLPETLKIAGFDEHQMNLLVRTSHDGGGSLVCAATPVRISCTNMVLAAMREAPRVWRASHTGTLEGKIMNARHALQLVTNYGDAWDLAVQELLAKEINDNKYENIAEEVFGTKHRGPALDLRRNSENIADFRTTAYGAYNALTEYAQWIRPRQVHLESAVHGTVARQSARAYELVNA
jgi:phage/plasmid-like protein (TIGR03299 family)